MTLFGNMFWLVKTAPHPNMLMRDPSRPAEDHNRPRRLGHQVRVHLVDYDYWLCFCVMICMKNTVGTSGCSTRAMATSCLVTRSNIRYLIPLGSLCVSLAPSYLFNCYDRAEKTDKVIWISVKRSNPSVHRQERADILPCDMYSTYPKVGPAFTRYRTHVFIFGQQHKKPNFCCLVPKKKFRGKTGNDWHQGSSNTYLYLARW